MKSQSVSLGLLIGTLALLPSAWAGTVTPGSYEGQGSWRSVSGGRGSYSVTTLVVALPTGSQVTSTYDFGTQPLTVTLELGPEANGFFDVTSQGVKIGSGYCMTIQCHYRIDTAEGPVEESLTFYQGHLYRLGSKAKADGLISWQEAQDLAGSRPVKGH